MRRVARFQVHDPENQCRLGDVVRIEETRPISKTKHWRILEILQRRQVADVAPIELESDAEIVDHGADATDDSSVAENSAESEGDSTDDETDHSSADAASGDGEQQEDEAPPSQNESDNEDGRL
jgi:hypothetical protein